MTLITAEAQRRELKHSFLKAMELGKQVEVLCVCGTKGH